MESKRNYWIFGGLVGALLMGTLVGGAYFYVTSSGAKTSTQTQSSTILQESKMVIADKTITKPQKSASSNSESLSSSSSESSKSKLEDILSSKSQSSQSSTSSSQSLAESPKVGFVKGQLSYPSEGLIGVNACAQNLNTGEVYCTERVNSSNQQNYQLDIPEGEYEIFSTSNNLKKTRAYYDEHVECGLTVECSTKNPSPKTIVIKVKNGESVTGINPSNWYNSAEYDNSNL
jgi:hypothetical protein